MALLGGVALKFVCAQWPSVSPVGLRSSYPHVILLDYTPSLATPTAICLPTPFPVFSGNTSKRNKLHLNPESGLFPGGPRLKQSSSAILKHLFFPPQIRTFLDTDILWQPFGPVDHRSWMTCSSIPKRN